MNGFASPDIYFHLSLCISVETSSRGKTMVLCVDCSLLEPNVPIVSLQIPPLLHPAAVIHVLYGRKG